MRNLGLTLLFVFTLCGAHSQSLPEQVSITAPTFESYFGVYFLEDSQISSEEVEQLVKKWLPEFQSIDAFPEDITEDAYILEYFDNVQADFAPFNMESLQYFGIELTEAEKLSLQKSSGAFSLTFVGTSNAVVDKQRNISLLLDEIAQSGSFILTDYNTYQAFNRDSWNTYRIDNFKKSDVNVVDQITIHTYREYEFCRAITLGMNKYALPELSIKAFSCSDQGTFGSLINSIVQHMAERGTMNSDSTFNIDLESIKNHTVRERFLADL